jgi:F420H(2)-dependent quinone reductase
VRDSGVKRWSAFHRLLYEATNGMLGRRLVGNDMLLLTTRGRLTGRPHTVPLLYLRDGDRFLVIASYGGRDHHPEWYLNLLADPSVSVRVADRKLALTARTASSAEREEWWPKVVASYGDYAVYQTRTDREIPIVTLERPG